MVVLKITTIFLMESFHILYPLYKDKLRLRVSNGTGQCNFLGQTDRSFFIVPGHRYNGTSSKSCHGTERDFWQAIPSRDVLRDKITLKFWHLNKKKIVNALVEHVGIVFHIMNLNIHQEKLLFMKKKYIFFLISFWNFWPFLWQFFPN